jgi:hypothetical protein
MAAPFHRLVARLRALFTSRQLDRDLDDEIALHVQLRAEALERSGLPSDPALRAARIEFGGVTQLLEAHRAERGVPWLEVIVRDLRMAVRALRRDGGFTIFALLPPITAREPTPRKLFDLCQSGCAQPVSTS